MAGNLFALLAKLLGIHSVDRDLEIDDFVERLQHSLMTAPYGRDRRRLKRFALRHANPEYAEVFRAKERLFEQQQREFRPPGALGACMYFVEKTLGRLFSSRALLPGSLLSAAAAAAALTWFPAARWQDWGRPPAGELTDPYAVRIEEVPAPTEEKPFDDWIHQQVLAAMRSSAFRDELKAILREDDGSRPATAPDAGALVGAIESALPAVLEELPLADEQRHELLRLLGENHFAASLASEAERHWLDNSSVDVEAKLDGEGSQP